MITIRKATINDIDLIMQFIKDLAEFEKLSDAVVFDKATISKNLFGEVRYAHCLIADYDNEAAGFVIYFFNFSTFEGKPGLYIEDLFVKEDYRGKGIGFKLFRECTKIASEKSCGRMEWSVLDWNPAREFYEKLGAKGLNDWILHRLNADNFGSITG
jgi:GNAT superfamily N-acetyltransferase